MAQCSFQEVNHLSVQQTAKEKLGRKNELSLEEAEYIWLVDFFFFFLLPGNEGNYYFFFARIADGTDR